MTAPPCPSAARALDLKRWKTAMSSPAPCRSADALPEQTIAIVGGGFSGCLLAAHLLRAAQRPLAIHLIEARGRRGVGVAYATRNNAHLLNVRAQNMSAFPDDAGHFLRWLSARSGGEATPQRGQSFATRAEYGVYIQDVLAQARAAAPPYARLIERRGEVVGLAPTDGGAARLRLADGGDLTADSVALCIGNFPPLPPALTSASAKQVLASDRFLGNPWDNEALAAIDRDARVVILGTGLTMVDIALLLLDQGHRGAITTLSRRGFLPHRHAETRPIDAFLHPDRMPRTVLDVLIALRAAARRADEAGDGWRSAFDALRPYHHRLWAGLSLDERRRFLRHARPFWDIHRHRMAPTVADRIDAARASGQLTVQAGRLTDLVATGNGLELSVLARGGARRATLQGDVVINAIGTNCDYDRVRHPLVRSLLDQGLARPDPLRLGLDVAATGALIGANGVASARVVALGPVSKAPFWEMVAVPELRLQCFETAKRLLDGLGE